MPFLICLLDSFMRSFEFYSDTVFCLFIFCFEERERQKEHIKIVNRLASLI